jgi:hypothetical protein
VVINDLYVLGSRFRPSKADPVLFVYPNAVLAAAISLEAF